MPSVEQSSTQMISFRSGVAWTRSRMVSIVFSSLYTGISTDSVTVAGSSGVSSRGFAASVKVRWGAAGGRSTLCGGGVGGRLGKHAHRWVSAGGDGMGPAGSPSLDGKARGHLIGALVAPRQRPAAGKSIPAGGPGDVRPRRGELSRARRSVSRRTPRRSPPRPCRRRRTSSPADAAAAPPQLVDELRGELGARGAERVAERDRAAVHVDAVRRSMLRCRAPRPAPARRTPR